MTRRTLSMFLVLILSAGTISAVIPHQMPYQGRLLDSGGDPVADGSYELTFSLYDAPVAGNLYWTSGPQMVPVENGLFNYVLGSVNPLPDSAFSGEFDLYFGLRVGADPEMTPRTQIWSQGFAWHAFIADAGDVFRLIPRDIPVEPCDASLEGGTYYDSVLNEPCYCNGSNWMQVDGGGFCDCVDLDGDGYDVCDSGDPRDTDGQPADCDDSDPSVNPGGIEICNGIDDDCDGFIDANDFSLVGTTYYQDADGDGFGDALNSIVGCTLEPGYSLDNTDCDDSNPSVNPTAAEVCDGVDNDCDGFIDDDDFSLTGAPTWYADSDGDGYGDANLSVVACNAPSGYVANNSDCDDGNAAVNPTAVEICDGIDNDCDGFVDDDDFSLTGAPIWFRDFDGDGYGDPGNTVTACVQPANYVSNNLDCDDTDVTVSPDAPEVCDGIDNDCDGFVDEGC